MEILELQPNYFFFTQQPNILPLARWSVEIGESSVVWSAAFWVREFLGPLRLRTENLPFAFDSNRNPQGFRLVLNGETVDGPADPCFFDLTAFVWNGENRLDLHIDPSRLTGPVARPLFLEGDFALIQSEVGELISHPSSTLRVGSWTEQGYPYFFGTGVYRQKVTLPERFLNGTMTLQFSDVADRVDVLVNGQPAGEVLRHPWQLDVTPRCVSGENVFEFRAVNSAAPRTGRPCPASGIVGPVVLEVTERVF